MIQNVLIFRLTSRLASNCAQLNNHCVRRSFSHHAHHHQNNSFRTNSLLRFNQSHSRKETLCSGALLSRLSASTSPITLHARAYCEKGAKKKDDEKEKKVEEVKKKEEKADAIEQEASPEDKVKKFKEEISKLEEQIVELKGQPTSLKEGHSIKIEEGKYDKRPDDDEEIVYRMAYDFPGFKLKNIRVTVVDQILRVYAFQTSSKKDKDTKEYIYENTTEEILPKEVDVHKMRATFDSENGFLIVEAILPEDSDLKAITKRTNELNDKLYKLEKELETKKKELSKIKV